MVLEERISIDLNLRWIYNWDNQDIQRNFIVPLQKYLGLSSQKIDNFSQILLTMTNINGFKVQVKGCKHFQLKLKSKQQNIQQISRGHLKQVGPSFKYMSCFDYH